VAEGEEEAVAEERGERGQVREPHHPLLPLAPFSTRRAARGGGGREYLEAASRATSTARGVKRSSTAASGGGWPMVSDGDSSGQIGIWNLWD
jgi:hypothetical protein